MSRNIAWALPKCAMGKTQVLLSAHGKTSVGIDFGLSQREGSLGVLGTLGGVLGAPGGSLGAF